MKSHRSFNCVPWILILITVAVWGISIPHDFAPVDDVMTISQNPKLNPPRFTSDSIGWYWTHPYMGLFVPVTYTVWGVLAKATWSPTPGAHGLFLTAPIFHAASVFFHGMSVLAVYGILRRLLRRTWPACAGALLFAVHPLQVEAIAWASGLKDVMSGAFALLAIWLYLNARIDDDSPEDAETIDACLRARLYFWSVASLVIAMLCKPSAMVTPLIAMAIDYFILRRPFTAIVRGILPWFFVVIPLAIIAKSVQPGTGVLTVSVLERPVVAGASIAFYFGKLLLPIHLTFDYGWRPIELVEKKWFFAIASIPLAMAAYLFHYRRRRGWLIAGTLVSVAALLPVLGFVPFMFQNYSTVADHYAYVAMLGPAMVLARALVSLPKLDVRFTSAVCGLVLMTFTALTIQQLRHWKNEETLLHHMIEIQPKSLIAHNGLGKLHESRRDFANAKVEYEKCLAFDSHYLPARENLVNLARLTGHAGEAIRQIYALMEQLKLKRDADPAAYNDAFFQMGQLTVSQGLTADAARYFREDLRLNPNRRESQTALKLAEEKLQASVREENAD